VIRASQEVTSHAGVALETVRSMPSATNIIANLPSFNFRTDLHNVTDYFMTRNIWVFVSRILSINANSVTMAYSTIYNLDKDLQWLESRDFAFNNA
jgi:hypothetical protein